MITHIHTTTSTMDFEPPSLPHIVLARRQMAGIGRTGDWMSPEGNFYCTFFMERFENALLFFTAVAADLLDLQLYWPNDLILNGLKCGGVLVNQKDDVVKVGLGINFVPTGPFGYLQRSIDFDELALSIYNNVMARSVQDVLQIYSTRSKITYLRCKGKGIRAMNERCQLINEDDEIMVEVTSAMDLDK